MSKFTLFSTISLTLCCVACQSTPPINNSKPNVQSLPPVVNQPVQTAPITPPTTSNQINHGNQTLVIFYKDAFKSAIISAIDARQAEIIYDYKLMNGVAIRLASSDNINQALQDLGKITGVIAVNHDQIPF